MVTGLLYAVDTGDSSSESEQEAPGLPEISSGQIYIYKSQAWQLGHWEATGGLEVGEEQGQL